MNVAVLGASNKPGRYSFMYLPLTVQIQVEHGDRVVAGETVVATRCGYSTGC